MSLNLFQLLALLSLSFSWWPFLFSFSLSSLCFLSLLALVLFPSSLKLCHWFFIIKPLCSWSFTHTWCLIMQLLAFSRKTCYKSPNHSPPFCHSSLARLPRSRPVSGAAPCARLRGLTPGQVGVCRAQGEVMESVRKAAEMVIEEVWTDTTIFRVMTCTQCYYMIVTITSFMTYSCDCLTQCQHQFRNRRWNCSTTPRGINVFGRVMNQGTPITELMSWLPVGKSKYSAILKCPSNDFPATCALFWIQALVRRPLCMLCPLQLWQWLWPEPAPAGNWRGVAVTGRSGGWAQRVSLDSVAWKCKG